MTDENLQKAIEFAASQLNQKCDVYVRSTMESHLTYLTLEQSKRSGVTSIERMSINGERAVNHGT